MNPYLEVLVNRDLLNNVFTIGNLSHYKDCFMENFTTSFSQHNDELNVKGKLHWRVTKNNFALNFITAADLKNLCQGTSEKRVSLEYSKNNFHLSLVEAQNQPESWKSWCGSCEVGVAYDGVQNQTFGWKMHLDKDELKNSTHHLAYLKKLNDLTLKGKVDNLLNAELWGNFNLQNGISLQGTIGGNLNGTSEGGFLGTPFKFGVKLKYAE